MTLPLRLFDMGPDIEALQAQLARRGFYRGPINGAYGIAVEAAVMAFQASVGLTPDGVTGPCTWEILFGSLSGATLTRRCLTLTGGFETSSADLPGCFAGISGDFDGQGISFGVAQWNIGQGSLQPLLNETMAKHPDVMREVFQDNLDALRDMLGAPKAQQLAWARSIQTPDHGIISEPWRSQFRMLGRTPQFQAIQVDAAEEIYQTALRWCARYGLITERAVALMFDIRVQNYSISPATEELIRSDFATLSPDDEAAKLRSIANRRAEAANSRYREDVRLRKLTIANGGGTVHGRKYDLERQFGIRLQPFT